MSGVSCCCEKIKRSMFADLSDMFDSEANGLEDKVPVAIRICFAEYCFESTSTVLAETNLANP